MTRTTKKYIYHHNDYLKDQAKTGCVPVDQVRSDNTDVDRVTIVWPLVAHTTLVALASDLCRDRTTTADHGI